MLKKYIKTLQSKRRKRRLATKTPTEVFSRVYQRNKWGGKESRSGKGSDLEQTQELIVGIPELLRRHQITSMVDLPCGDFNWMQHADLSGISYLGGDIVPELIESNRKLYAEPNVRFEVCDLISGPVPQAELLHVRDCLVHLSVDHIRSAVQNMKRSGATYLLSTTFPDTVENTDILTGEFRPINLQGPPFNFPKPIEMIDEWYPGKFLALWRIADLPDN